MRRLAGIVPSDGRHLDPAGDEVAGAVGEPDGGFLGSLLRDLVESQLAGEGLASRVDLLGVLAEGGAAADGDGGAVGLGDELLAGEAVVTVGAADLEGAGAVDE